MSNPRILIFASYFAPNSFSEALVNNKFALSLIAIGWDVTIITSGVYSGDKYEESWNEMWEPLKKRTYNIPSITPHEKSSLLKKIHSTIIMKHPINGVRWAFKAYKLAIKMHAEKPFDALFSRTISDHGHLPALKFKKKTGIKWIANWNDPPFFIFPAPYKIDSNWLTKKIYYRYLKDVATKADYNTFPSERLFRYIQSNLKIFNNSKVEIIPHLNTNLKIRKAKKNNDKFRICHAGNLSKERSPDNFLQAYKKLVAKYKTNIECYIIGIESVDLSIKIDKLNLSSSIKFTGPLSYQETLEFLFSCSIGLLIEAQCNEGIFLPSKISDYVKAQLPILAISPPIGTVNDLFKEYGGGNLADNNSIKDIFVELEKLFHCWEKNTLNLKTSTMLESYLSDAYMHSKIKEMFNK